MKMIVYFSKSYCVDGDTMADAQKKAGELFEKDMKDGLQVDDCLSDIEYADEDEELD